jgi:hypothetical protein
MTEMESDRINAIKTNAVETLKMEVTVGMVLLQVVKRMDLIVIIIPIQVYNIVVVVAAVDRLLLVD